MFASLPRVSLLEIESHTIPSTGMGKSRSTDWVQGVLLITCLGDGTDLERKGWEFGMFIVFKMTPPLSPYTKSIL